MSAWQVNDRVFSSETTYKLTKCPEGRRFDGQRDLSTRCFPQHEPSRQVSTSDEATAMRKERAASRPGIPRTFSAPGPVDLPSFAFKLSEFPRRPPSPTFQVICIQHLPTLDKHRIETRIRGACSSARTKKALQTDFNPHPFISKGLLLQRFCALALPQTL